MIEIKLSQGAKPGHGGVLPAAKVTPEISAIRGVPMGQDCVSPPGHSAFSTPLELMAFIRQLRELSGGKPVGIKFCLGQPVEFLSICKAMLAERDGAGFHRGGRQGRRHRRRATGVHGPYRHADARGPDLRP